MSEGTIATIAGGIILLGAVSYAISLLWSHTIRPLYHAIIHISEFMEALPTIMSIAHEFESTGGKTLRNEVDSISVRLTNIEGQLESLITNHR